MFKFHFLISDHFQNNPLRREFVTKNSLHCIKLDLLYFHTKSQNSLNFRVRYLSFQVKIDERMLVRRESGIKGVRSFNGSRRKILKDHISYVFSIEAKGCLSSSTSLPTACFRVPRVSVTVSEYSIRPLVTSTRFV